MTAASIALEAELDRLQADNIREDGRIERHCSCGIGHTVGHMRGYLLGQYESSHGCCGKHCDDYLMQEVRDAH